MIPVGNHPISLAVVFLPAGHLILTGTKRFIMWRICLNIIYISFWPNLFTIPIS